MFPIDNTWNTDISTLPVHALSKKWLATMYAGTTDLNPDFGPPSYGMPYAVVSDDTPTHTVKFQYASESDRVP